MKMKKKPIGREEGCSRNHSRIFQLLLGVNSYWKEKKRKKRNKIKKNHCPQGSEHIAFSWEDLPRRASCFPRLHIDRWRMTCSFGCAHKLINRDKGVCSQTEQQTENISLFEPLGSAGWLVVVGYLRVKNRIEVSSEFPTRQIYEELATALDRL